MTEIKEQAGKVLGHVAGYVATRTLDMGLEKGLFAAIAEHGDSGTNIDSLAEELSYDPFYVEVWCRSALASDFLEVNGPADEEYDPETRRFLQHTERRYRLAPHMQTLLLDSNSPAFVGALPQVMKQREFFDLFADNLASGERLWWNDCSHEMIKAVSATGWSFYLRLVPGGLEQVPGLAADLERGIDVMELCCGAGRGTERLAQTYPSSRFSALDGDEYSLQLARERLDAAQLPQGVELVHSMLEDMQLADLDLVVINISMHECRDIDEVIERVKAGLRPGGRFVISDFPFPGTAEAQRTVPGRIMSGIQFFEALIEDQLMPTHAFVDLLEKFGFRDVASFDITPVHAVTYGVK